ncbi:MAG: hypothetical protein E7539_02715 [Ruminococcaceae bacterium]|nr:hypothetical protein [Oscillospiraceae bacterium]
MMDRQPKAKLNIPMCIACILLCLTLFSFHLCGGLYAKYIVADSGEDFARVAKFDVSEDGAYFSKNLLVETTPGSVERSIEVVNNSEVVVAYTVTIENATKNIPYTFSVDNSTPAKDKCSVVCYLKPNSTNKIKMVATWSEQGALKYMGMADLIKLTIKAEQVD